MTCSPCTEAVPLTEGYFVAPVRAVSSSCACLSRAVACTSVGLFRSASLTMPLSSGEWNTVHHCAGISADGFKCWMLPAGPALLTVSFGCGWGVYEATAGGAGA